MAKKNKRGRGEGGIETLPSGKFRVRLDAGINPATGKRERLSETFDKITDARTWLRQQLDKRDKGEIVAGGTESLQAWFDEWLLSKQDTTSQVTWVQYRSHFNTHILPVLKNVKLKELNQRVLLDWSKGLAEKGTSPLMRRKILTTFSICLSDAVLAQKIAVNPLRASGGVKRPRVETAEIEVFTVEECRRLLKACRETRARHGPLFVLLLDSGMRPGEALALQWGKIDFAGSKVSVTRSLQVISAKGVEERFKVKETKTANGRRTISLTPETMACLQAHRERMAGEGLDTVTGDVFTTERENQVSGDSLPKAWKRICKVAEVPYRKPYTLRHTSASLLIQAGVSIKTVSRRLGHEDISITLKFYSHLLPGSDEQAAEVLRGLIFSTDGRAAH